MGTIVPNMGTTQDARTAPCSLGDELFTQTQQRVIGLVFGQPDRSFYAKEIIRLAHAGSGAVQRELDRLARSGLITIREIGNQKHYQANADSPIFEELRAITDKSFGLAQPMKVALAGLARRIKFAFVYGSVAKKRDTARSDVDLMIVADRLSHGELIRALEEPALMLGRPINPTIFSAAEFSQRRKRHDSFVSRVLTQPKIWLIGGEHELTA
jgi:predicted nucleotidyltransferase